MTDHLGRDFATSVCMGINYSPEGPKKRHIYIYVGKGTWQKVGSQRRDAIETALRKQIRFFSGWYLIVGGKKINK